MYTELTQWNHREGKVKKDFLKKSMKVHYVRKTEKSILKRRNSTCRIQKYSSSEHIQGTVLVDMESTGTVSIILVSLELALVPDGW